MTRAVVVDSSVAVKWFLDEREQYVDEALALQVGHDTGEHVLAAPSLLLLEVLNVLKHRGVRSEVLTQAASRLLAARLQLEPLESLAQRAGQIAVEHGLSVYDATFVALAESLDAELVTADRRLAACTACRTRLLGET